MGNSGMRSDIAHTGDTVLINDTETQVTNEVIFDAYASGMFYNDHLIEGLFGTSEEGYPDPYIIQVHNTLALRKNDIEARWNEIKKGLEKKGGNDKRIAKHARQIAGELTLMEDFVFDNMWNTVTENEGTLPRYKGPEMKWVEYPGNTENAKCRVITIKVDGGKNAHIVYEYEKDRAFGSKATNKYMWKRKGTIIASDEKFNNYLALHQYKPAAPTKEYIISGSSTYTLEQIQERHEVGDKLTRVAELADHLSTVFGLGVVSKGLKAFRSVLHLRDFVAGRVSRIKDKTSIVGQLNEKGKIRRRFVRTAEAAEIGALIAGIVFAPEEGTIISVGSGALGIGTVLLNEFLTRHHAKEIVAELDRMMAYKVRKGDLSGEPTVPRNGSKTSPHSNREI